MVIPAQPRRLNPVVQKPRLPPIPVPRPTPVTASGGNGDDGDRSVWEKVRDFTTGKLADEIMGVAIPKPILLLGKQGNFGQGVKDRLQLEQREVSNIVRNMPAGTARFFGGLGVDLIRSVDPFFTDDDELPLLDPNSTSRQAVSSFLHTLAVWDRIPKYVEAYKANKPISGMLIEDAGNLSIFGRGAGSALGKISKATGTVAAERGAAAAAAEAAATSASEAAAGAAMRGATSDAAAAASKIPGFMDDAAAYAAKAERMAKISGWAERSSARTHLAVDYVDKFANFPFKPYIWIGKGLGKGIRNGAYVESLSAGWGAKAAKAYIQQIDDIRAANPDMPDNHPDLQSLRKKASANMRMSLTHAQKAKIRQAVRNAEFESNLIKKKLLDIQQNPEFKDVINPATGEVWGELSQIENEAIIAVLNGRAALIKWLTENLNKTPEQIAELGRYDATPEYHLSGSGARLALDLVNGNLSPEHYQRLSAAIENLATALIEVSQKAVDGYGRKNILSTDYLIPLPFVNRLKAAVLKSKNKELIALFKEAEENGIFELPANDQLRQSILVAIVESLPDELALDPTMYPATMRENIEFYRRVRRSYNQEATGAAVGEPLPPRDGRPRAPKEPWDPFKEEGAEPVDRPEQFNMPPSRGRLNAAENLLAKTKGKLGKLAADVIKITDKIALLEEKHVKLQEQVRKYDVVDAHLAGMNEKAIAKKYRISVAQVREIIAKNPVAKQATKLAETSARLAELQKIIGKKRASLPEGAIDAELAVLQQELAAAEAAAMSARQAVEAAKNINEIARQADESAINNLTNAIDIAEDDLYDSEKVFEDAGGDVETLKVPVDPKEVFPITPERGDLYIGQLKALANSALKGLQGSGLEAVIPNLVSVIEAAWNDANNFMENAQTPAEVRVADLRMEQLGDVISDVTQELNKAIYETPDGVTMEQAVGDAIVKVLNDDINKKVIAGTAPLVKGGVVRGGEPRGTIFNKLNAKRDADGNLDIDLASWSKPNDLILKKNQATDEIIQAIIDDTSDPSVFPQREASTNRGTVYQLSTAANIIARYIKEVRAATTKEAKLQLILNPPDYVPSELYADMTRGMSRDNIPVDENAPTHPFRKFSKKADQYLSRAVDGLERIEKHFELHDTATQVLWGSSGIPNVRTLRDSQGGPPSYEITLPSIPKTGTIPSLRFSGDTPLETVVDAIDALEKSINEDLGAQGLRVDDILGRDPEKNYGWGVRIEGLTKAKSSFKKSALKDIADLRKSLENLEVRRNAGIEYRDLGVEVVRPESRFPGIRDNVVPIEKNAGDLQDLFWDEDFWPGKEEASQELSNMFGELDDFYISEGLTQDQVILNNFNAISDPAVKQQVIEALKEAITQELKSKKSKLVSDLEYVLDVVEGRGATNRLTKVDDVLEQAKPVEAVAEEAASLIDPDLEQLANTVAEDPSLYATFKAQVEERAMLERDIESMRNPSPEDTETYRKGAQNKAQEEVRTYAGALENIGGKWDKANDSVTFYVNVRSGTAEWEWWDRLDPRERRRLARTYFRSTTERSTAVKGPKLIRVADNIDQLADPYGLTPDEWGQKFLETVREYERAKKNLKDTKSKNFDPLAAIDDNPELQQAQEYLDRLVNEEGVDNDMVQVVNRAREIIGDNEIASLRTVADSPENVIPDRKIADPTVRQAAYEADVINAMAKEATKKMRSAQRASERLKAFEEYIVESAKYRDQAARLIKLQGTGNKARLALAKNTVAQSALREKIKDKKKQARKLKIIENRLEGPQAQTLADIQTMKGAVPLQVAMEGGYPSEQFNVKLPGGEPFQLQGPMYVPTGRPAMFTGGLAMDLQRAGLRGFEMLSSEHFRDGDRQTIFSIRNVAARLGKDVGRMSSNEAYKMLVAQFGNTAFEVLGEDMSRSLYEKAYEKVSGMSQDDLNYAARVVGDKTAEIEGTAAFSSGVPNPKAAFNAALRAEYGRLLVIEMGHRGMTAIDAYSSISSLMAESRVTHETMFVPDGFKEQITLVEAVIDPTSWNAALRGMHKVTSQFKTSTLVLSIAWQLGDLFSNMIIAHMSGVNVVDMIKRMKEVKAEEYGPGFRTLWDPTSELPTATPKIRIAKESPIQDISASLADRRYLYNIPEGDALPPLLTRLTGKQYPEAVRGRGLINTSFKINETINRIQRHAYFLEILDKKLSDLGLDLDTVAADESWRSNADLRQVVFDAADTANDFLGDFADLSMRERKYVAAFIPFYAWTKHIHKVFVLLGEQNPAALRWYIYMGTLCYDPDEDPMGLRYGNPSWFGGAFSTNIVNPFGDVFGGPIASMIGDEDIRPALNTLGPVPRLAGAAAFGVNVAKGFQPISRPAGSGNYSLSGSEQNAPLAFRPRELAGFTMQQFPIVNRVANILPGSRIPGTRIALGPVARYDTGERRLSPRTRQPVEKWGGRTAALGRLFSIPGIPYQADDQIEDVMRSARARLRTLETLKRRRALETGDTVP
jgi:hypothetical protein